MESEYRTTASFPVFRALGAPRKGPLDRFLSIFADVRAGEGAGAVLLAFAGFLLFTSYYLVKPVREALILTQAKAEVAAYSAAAQAALLLLVVPAYGALASRVNRKKLLTWVTVFFVANLLLFFAAGRAGAQIGVVFYIWLGIYNTLLPAQLWGFANDLYTESQGKRLFPIIGAGTTIGALAGAQASSHLIKPLGPYMIMIATAVLLVGTVVALRIVHAREAGRATGKRKEEAERPVGGAGGFRLVLKDRYLLMIGVLVLLLNIVNTNGETILRKILASQAAASADTAAREVMIGQFYGNYYSYTNLAGVIVQLFLVSRIFHYIGVRGALFVLPLISLGGYSLAAFLPALILVRNVKVAENATDYSLYNTARHALFLPTSREAKYKAKAAIDTFFMRGGDMLAAAVVYVGSVFAFSISGLAAVNAVFALVWIGVVWVIARDHRRRSEERPALAVRR